jgi:hypothetical protein
MAIDLMQMTYYGFIFSITFFSIFSWKQKLENNLIIKKSYILILILTGPILRYQKLHFNSIKKIIENKVIHKDIIIVQIFTNENEIFGAILNPESRKTHNNILSELSAIKNIKIYKKRILKDEIHNILLDSNIVRMLNDAIIPQNCIPLRI